MTRRFLCVGDLHIKPNNVDEIRLVLAEVQRVAATTQPTDIVLLGDVLHTHEKILSPCLNRAVDFVTECARLAPTFVLVGNHDYQTNSEFLSPNHWMNALKQQPRVTIVDTVVHQHGVLFCPYVPPGRFLEAIGEWPRATLVIFCHQEFHGCAFQSTVSETGDPIDQKWPQIVSGHIHDNQTLRHKVYYPGAPLQHNFGDSEKRVLCLVTLDLDDGLVGIAEYPLQVPLKKIINASIDDLHRHTTTIDSAVATKIKVHSTSDEFKAFKQTQEYKNLIKQGIVVQLAPDATASAAPIDVTGSGHFRVILETLVNDTRDPLIRQLFDDLVTSSSL